MRNKNEIEVEVQVMSGGAIYVDDCRITNRSTKWGIKTPIDTFKCAEKDVRRICLERGHNEAVIKIDLPFFEEQS